MKITETRKAIIELIEPYMDKTLGEGCLIKTDGYTITISEEDTIENSDELVLYRKNEDEFYCIDEIIGHYDITAVLKYIDNISRDYRGIPNNLETCLTPTDIVFYYKGEAYHIPNKPLHLYTDEEDKQLLDLLLKLK